VTDIAEVQHRAWDNKVSKGFNQTDVYMEFALTYVELSEAFEALRKNPGSLGSELADVIIFVAGLAEMTGVDLDAEVSAKLDINESRTYSTNEYGHLVKDDDDPLSRLLP
jgi:NTP pyrophosphatase (non-canonical NTP hydrolase)